jgi:hypothetical protein
MGLKCLLGHDFGPSGVVREHEEDGSEMVVTEREIRLCRRCGEEKVLSESTEVRAIRTEDDVGIDRRDADAVAPAGRTQGPAAANGDESTTASTPLNETADTVGPANGTDPAVVEEPNDGASADEHAERVTGDAAETDDSNTSLLDRAEAGFDDDRDAGGAVDPSEEDAVILDETDEAPERGHGEWPDSSDVGSPPSASADGGRGPVDDVSEHARSDDAAASNGPPDSPDAAPADGDTGDGVDTDAGGEADDVERTVAETAAEEDAELLDSGTDETDAPDAGEATTGGHGTTDAGGSWPAHEGNDEGFAAAGATAGGPDVAYGNSIAPESTNGEDHDDGYETSYLDKAVEERDGDGTIVSASHDDVSGRAPGVQTEYYCPNCGHARPLDSSLRSGDICPECQQGYIAERER